MAKFRELRVWQSAHELTVDLYRHTRRFPRDERFGLTGQIRRAAVSIGANIAEGSNQSSAAFARYIGVAIGSANELEYLLQIAVELEFTSDASLIDRAALLGRMLQRLRSYLTRRSRTGSAKNRSASDQD